MENNIETKEIPEVVAKKSQLSIPNAIILAAIIIAGAVFVSKGSTNSATISGGDKLDLVSEITAEDFIRGDENAPITLIEYADFSCHFCAEYHPTLQKIVADYDGRVRWVYRHLPIFNIEAAIASSCIGKLGGTEAFWNFSDTLFANPDNRNREYYLATALANGLVETEYTTCTKDPAIKSKITTEFNQNRILLGFDATPYTVLIDKNGRKFSFAGALSYENLTSVIDGLDK